MIVPMKKVSIVVLEKERMEALKQLRKLGLVHVEEVAGESEKLSEFKQQNNKIATVISQLSEIKLKKTDEKVDELNQEQASDLCNKILEWNEEKKNLIAQITQDQTELERFSKWGKIVPADFEYLESKGIFLSMYEIPRNKYASIPAEINTLLVNQDKVHCRFFVISDHKPEANERPQGLSPEAYQVVLPRCSTEELLKIVEKNAERVEEIESDIENSAKFIPSLKKAAVGLSKDIEIENLYSGMGKEEESSENPDEIRFAWLTGFCPAEDLDKVKAAVAENKWAMKWEDPSDEDNVPTKLKNNKFVSLIYPLTDFLGTVPGYHEYDISGWFLGFFTIFFGMIFGDAGYGSLITLVALAFILKSAFGGKKVSPMLKLVLLLGIATVAWGTVTCTWFGLTPEQLPKWLVALSVPPISGAYADVQWLPFWTSSSEYALTKDNNLQIFCFTLALIQLCVAHLKGIVRFVKAKSLKAIAEFGSFIELIGMYWVVLSMVVNAKIFPMIGGDVYGLPWGTISIGLVGVGFVLSFVFANYEGSIGKSILESLKNIISVLLGVVNVFSDIVSYIRLWAVGLAGAAISSTVNTMAGPLIGHAVMFVLLVVLLVFGHGLNMILNLLSVIVHGVRLNTLEFSNHLGMSWSGFKYEPFSEK